MMVVYAAIAFLMLVSFGCGYLARAIIAWVTERQLNQQIADLAALRDQGFIGIDDSTKGASKPWQP